MMYESNSEIQIETSINQIEIDYIFVVHETILRDNSSAVELKTHSEYFMSREEAERYINSQSVATEPNMQRRYSVQGLTKSMVTPRLVFSKVITN